MSRIFARVAEVARFPMLQEVFRFPLLLWKAHALQASPISSTSGAADLPGRNRRQRAPAQRSDFEGLADDCGRRYRRLHHRLAFATNHKAPIARSAARRG